MTERSKEPGLTPVKSFERESAVRAVFEHLFPGSVYNALPGHKLKSIPSMGLRMVQGVRADARLVNAASKGKTDALRVNFPAEVDNLCVEYEFEGALPTETQPGDGLFNGHLLTDLFDQEEEKLGGVATRRLRCYQDGYTSISLTGVSPFAVAQEFLIGVLGKDGKPKGYIRLVEGQNKRRPRRKEEILPVRIALTLPEMQGERIPVRY